MRCPACLKDVKDGLIICPYCNTQFDYNLIKHVDIKLSDDSIDPASSVNYERAEIVKDDDIEELIDYNPKVEVPVIPKETSNPFVESSNKLEDLKANNMYASSYIEDAKPLNDISFDEKQRIRNINQEALEEKKKNKNTYMIVSLFGFLLLGGLLFVLINYFSKVTPKINLNKTTASITTTSEVKVSKNEGVKSSYLNPHPKNTTVLASMALADDTFVDVDVRLNDYLTTYEAYRLSGATKIEDDLQWQGMNIKVKLNDLEDGINYNPVLNYGLYTFNGKVTSISYKEDTIPVNIKVIYDGKNISNGEEAIIKIVYLLPKESTSNYIVCFGEEQASLGCFITE